MNCCGVLVSQMKAGARPDAYFSCDVSFMNDVEHLFSPSITISQNDMVILIKKDKVDEIKKITGIDITFGTSALTLNLLRLAVHGFLCSGFLEDSMGQGGLHVRVELLSCHLLSVWSKL